MSGFGHRSDGIHVGLALGFALAVLSASAVATSAPKHDFCADIGGTVGVGVSSYSSAEGWPELAQSNGVRWNFLYYYVFPSQDLKADRDWYLNHQADIARGLDAMLVITFYDLLKRGQSAGLTARAGSVNSEADIVAQVLASPTLMRGYFQGFVEVLSTAATTGVPTLVHVEPDSWGFMMWAMGVEGRTDASTVPVAVVSSGFPDLAGQAFPDDASGFAQALLYLRDKYAPAVRLGWHASNFRNGANPEVVTGFYSHMGQWDVIVTEDPHVFTPNTWWSAFDPTAVDTNIAWFGAVSAAAGTPVLMWQVPIGPFDYHWLGQGVLGRVELSRFMAAGLGGILWELNGTGDPDTFRAAGADYNLPVPPTGSDAGGTAKDLRARLAAFATDPIAWPAGSPCAAAGGSSTSSGGATGTGGTNSAPGGTPANGGSGASNTTNASTGDASGCGCRLGISAPSANAVLLIALGVLRRRRKARARPVIAVR